MLIGIDENMTPINFVFTTLNVKVTRVTLVIHVSVHFPNNYLSQSLYISDLF